MNDRCIASKKWGSKRAFIGLVLLPILLLSLLVGIYVSTERISISVMLSSCTEVGSIVAIDENGQHRLPSSGKVVLKNSVTFKYLPALNCPAKAGSVTVGTVLSPENFQMKLLQDGSLTIDLVLRTDVYSASFFVTIGDP